MLLKPKLASWNKNLVKNFGSANSNKFSKWKWKVSMAPMRKPIDIVSSQLYVCHILVSKKCQLQAGTIHRYWGKELLTQQVTGSSTQTQPCDNAMSMAKTSITKRPIFFHWKESCRDYRLRCWYVKLFTQCLAGQWETLFPSFGKTETLRSEADAETSQYGGKKHGICFFSWPIVSRICYRWWMGSFLLPQANGLFASE